MLVLDKSDIDQDNASERDEHDLLQFLCVSIAVHWKDWPTEMECRLLKKDTNNFSLTGPCPHCRNGSVFMPVTNVYEFDRKLVAALQCQGCGEYVLGIANKHGANTFSYAGHYPLGNPDASVHKDVPAAIAADFSEALRCFWVKAFKATVAMCRRSVEASCHDLGAKGKNLNQRIDDLASSGIITESLKRMAHQVRLTANEELHGKPDDLDTIIEQDAEAIVAFTREYFHHVYVMPALLKLYEKAPTSSPP